MRKNVSISDAEWQVMRVLWSSGPATANEVVARLEGVRDWDPKTVRTLINRLIKKGALGYEKEGRAYRYHPRLAREEAVHRETCSLLSRIGRVGLGPMIAAFIEEEALDPETIEDLRAILERKDKG